MILDNDLVFSTAQDIGQVVGDYASTNVYDNSVYSSATGARSATAAALGGYGNINIDLLRGGLGGCEILITIIEAVTSGGAATIEFLLVQDDNTSLTSPAILASTGAIAYASLTAGAQVRLPIPTKGLTERYMGLVYRIAGATTTAGTVTAVVVASHESQPT